MTSPSVPIPQPPTKPVVGNLPDIDSSKGILGIVEVAERYGPIVRIQFFNRSIIAISSQQLVNEVCDESRFGKVLGVSLRQVREFVGDGLFTARTRGTQLAKGAPDPDAGVRASGADADVRGMDDIAEQLLLKWERLGPDGPDRRSGQHHPADAGHHRPVLVQLPFQQPLPGGDASLRRGHGPRPGRVRGPGAQAPGPEQDHAAQAPPARGRPCPDVRGRRPDDQRPSAQPQPARQRGHPGHHAQRGGPGDRRAVDREENVRYQMVTFLVAGHETTSGLLSFALYELLRHPAVLAKARAQVDEVLGTESARFEHLPRLGYLDQILKETLRLWPTAPAFNVAPYEDTTLGGRYEVPAGQPIMVLIPQLHRDKAAWGEDAGHLRPGPVLTCSGRGNPCQCLEALRQRAALLHRPGICPAGGHALPGQAPAALRRHGGGPGL